MNQVSTNSVKIVKILRNQSHFLLFSPGLHHAVGDDEADEEQQQNQVKFNIFFQTFNISVNFSHTER